MEKVYDLVVLRLENVQKSLLSDDKNSRFARVMELEHTVVKSVKDLKTPIYRQLLTDLGKAANIFKQICVIKDDVEDKHNFPALVAQTLHLVKLRKELSMMGIPNYDELLKIVKTVVSQTDVLLTHTQLSQIKRHLSCEARILETLFATQLSISRLQYMESILLLHSAKIQLDEWKHIMHQEQPSSASQKYLYVTWGYMWLGNFYTALLAKATFVSFEMEGSIHHHRMYFYPVFRKVEEDTQADPKQIAHILQKTEPNFVAMFETFAMKTDAFHISIIVDAEKLATRYGLEYNKVGYRAHTSDYNPADNIPTGINSWPSIYGLPKEPPVLEHWPNIISVIFENQEFLNRFGEPFPFFDRGVQCTYFISKLEVECYMVAIYVKKKDSKDPTILEHMHQISNALRLRKVFNELRT